MPTYEYRCPLGHDFEIFYRKMSLAPADVACPDCGRTAERMMSAGAGLVFKGSGFYITDYGKDGKKDERAARAASETRNDVTSDAKGDKGDVKSDAPKDSSETKSPAKSDGSAAPAAESKTTAKEPVPASSSSRSPTDLKTSRGSVPPSKAKE